MGRNQNIRAEIEMHVQLEDGPYDPYELAEKFNSDFRTVRLAIEAAGGEVKLRKQGRKAGNEGKNKEAIEQSILDLLADPELRVCDVRHRRGQHSYQTAAAFTVRYLQKHKLLDNLKLEMHLKRKRKSCR